MVVTHQVEARVGAAPLLWLVGGIGKHHKKTEKERIIHFTLLFHIIIISSLVRKGMHYASILSYNLCIVNVLKSVNSRITQPGSSSHIILKSCLEFEIQRELVKVEERKKMI